MSLKITINTIIIGSSVVWPGSQLDDGSTLGVQYVAAGGILAPADDAAMVTAAATVLSARKKGQSTDYCQGIMLAALGQSDSAAPGVYGDGSDGALVYDGTTTILGMAPSSSVYTLTRDIQATSITVNVGVSIVGAGFKIFVAGLLWNVTPTSIVHNGGKAGALGVAGAATGTGSYGVAGKAGGAGGVNAAGAAGTAATTAPTLAGAGGAGGAATNAGGAGGASATSAATVGTVKNLQAVLQGASLAASGTAFAGGAGGGGGGGVDASAVGGGGGGGGGCMLVCAYRVINNGRIHCDGGAGAAGSGSTASGGGGGGGGGVLALVTRHGVSGSGTQTAAAGAPGVGVVTGAVGVAGAAGQVLTLVA